MTPTRRRRAEQNKSRSWIGDRGHATFRHVLGMVDCPDSGVPRGLHNPPSEYQSMNQCTIGPCTVPNRQRKHYIRTERDPDMYKSMNLGSPGPATLLNQKDERMIEVRRKMKEKSSVLRTGSASARSEYIHTGRTTRRSDRQPQLVVGGGRR